MHIDWIDIGSKTNLNGWHVDGITDNFNAHQGIVRSYVTLYEGPANLGFRSISCMSSNTRLWLSIPENHKL